MPYFPVFTDAYLLSQSSLSNFVLTQSKGPNNPLKYIWLNLGEFSWFQLSKQFLKIQGQWIETNISMVVRTKQVSDSCHNLTDILVQVKVEYAIFMPIASRWKMIEYAHSQQKAAAASWWKNSEFRNLYCLICSWSKHVVLWCLGFDWQTGHQMFPSGGVLKIDRNFANQLASHYDTSGLLWGSARISSIPLFVHCLEMSFGTSTWHNNQI